MICIHIYIYIYDMYIYILCNIYVVGYTTWSMLVLWVISITSCDALYYFDLSYHVCWPLLGLWILGRAPLKRLLATVFAGTGWADAHLSNPKHGSPLRTSMAVLFRSSTWPRLTHYIYKYEHIYGCICFAQVTNCTCTRDLRTDE